MATGSMPRISRMAQKTVLHKRSVSTNMTTMPRSNGAMRMPRAGTASTHLLQPQGRALALAPDLAQPALVAILPRVVFPVPLELLQRALELPPQVLRPAKHPAKRRPPRRGMAMMTIGEATTDAQLPDQPTPHGKMSRSVKSSTTVMKTVLRTPVSLR